MQTIRKRLSIMFLISSILAILLIAIFVNITINSKFNEYMEHSQIKKHERIISFFEAVYQEEGKWTNVSGIELMHEAYMGNYCLTLRDSDQKVIWGMDQSDLKNRLHLRTMIVEEEGIYNTKTFEIKSKGKVVGFVDIGQYSPILLTEEDINFKTSINHSIIASGFVTLLLFVGISLVFSKNLSTPIKKIANISVALSNGNFDTKFIEQSNIEELEELRNSINILAVKLKSQDRLRKNLITDITHEVRTPLNVIQNNLEAMIDGVLPVTEERLNSLNEEVIRFGKLLNNLNALKEFELESNNLNLETIYLDKLLLNIRNDYLLDAQRKNIHFSFRVEPNQDYQIIGDKDKIKQVFINLLSNAFKFSKNDGKIEITLYAREDSIIVKVLDEGVGIKKEDIPFIFKRLYRGDKSRHEIEGHGIGLTIVKSILELHNAKIEVDSKEEKGTSIIICFKK